MRISTAARETTKADHPPALPLILPTKGGKTGEPFELISSFRGEIRDILLTAGAVVLRDLGIDDVQQFKKFTERFTDGDLLNYAGGASPRSVLANGVYTSTEYPPEMPLALHNELSYSDAFPRTLFFYCEIEPQIGGETTLGDSRRILSAIDPDIVELFRVKGVLYMRNLVSDENSPYSWQAAFETDDRTTAEMVCERQGSNYEWREDGGLRVSFVGPATIFHPETGEEVWFNQADGFHSGELQHKDRKERPRLEAYFGDGSEIPDEVLQHIRTVVHAKTDPHEWQKGDLLIVDNILAAHGRMPFTGPRKIVLAMA